MKRFTAGFLCCVNFLLLNSLSAQNVWTQHNDQGRTGWYPYETTLNTSNVNQNTFGISWKQTTDDKVVSQPLVVMGVNIPGKGIKNIVLVTTLNNTVYAYDADINVPAYWTTNFTKIKAPAPAALCSGCRPAFFTDIHPSLCYTLYPDFDGNMGIVGTPVVDTLRGVMYFVTKVADTNIPGGIDNHTFKSGVFDEYTYKTAGFHQYLHAVRISTGLDMPNSPVEIVASAMGTGDGQVPANSGTIPFDPRRQFARAGLALNNGKVYITFAAHCDFNPSHGWVLSYDTMNLNLQKSFIATPNDGRGGSWMSGTAPAIDQNGNLYFTTGNSLIEDPFVFSGEVHAYPNVDPSLAPNRGESVIKLAPDLSLSSYFTPFDYLALNDADKDFPIQVMLLPGTGHLLTGNKDDSLFILDQSNLGGFNPLKNNVLQSRFVVHPCEMHSSFAYFGGPTQFAYQYGENSPLRAYPITAGGLLGTEITNTTLLGPIGGSGGFMSVSSNGTDPNSAILWAYQAQNGCNANGSTCQGVLNAVKASDIRQVLWTSDMNGTTDHIDIFNKMSCPSIARGKVYIAANANQLLVYGPKASTTCGTLQSQNKLITAPNFASGFPPSNANDGNMTTNWTAGVNNDVDSIVIDLGAKTDICKIAITWTTNGFAKNYDLKTSNDGITWTTITSITNNAATYTEFNGAVTGRYVDMRGITRGTNNPYGIFEFQVYGSPSNPCANPTNLNASSGSNLNIFTTQTPVANDGPDGAVELGVRFTSSVAGFITGVRFYENTTFGGSHIGELYTATGTRLALATLGSESGSGWQTVTFGSPVAITANTTYVAAFYFGNGHHLGDAGGFNAAINNGNLTAPIGAGVFNYGATPSFPFNVFNNANYFIDPIFSLTVPTDPGKELITWDQNAGAAQYLVKYRPNLSDSWIYRTTNTNAIALSALTCETQYYYTVQADCGGGALSTVVQQSFITDGCPASSCDVFPVRYFNVDLGDIGLAGNTCYNHATNTWALTGSGPDIGVIYNGFQYTYTSSDNADYDLSARIIQQDQVSSNDKIGIMVSDSLSNTSRYAYLASVNNGANFIFEFRSTPASAPTTISFAGHPLPYWVKISKVGTTYTAFISPDDVNWTQVGTTQNLGFGTSAGNAPRYGMAVTSANNAMLSTGKIDNFTLLGSTPLPVKLLSFTARNINNDHILVSWATSMEHLVDHFEIERSTDNNGFLKIASAIAVGESETPHYYSVDDPKPLTGVNYYRLKEVDKDGKFYYSPVASVDFGANDGLEIYPNPADAYTTVSSPRDRILDVGVYDANGRLLQHIHSEAGLNSVRVNTTDLQKAIYFIRVKTTKSTYNQKLFKK